MTNIYDFPSRKTDTKDDGFLQHGSDTLAFDESGKHVDFSENVYQSLERSRAYENSDWSNQELASIYRVKCLLDAAEVPCTVERGQSDEGDPWCVYCTPGGEVFIHLCRISGTYILDSPNLSAPISGDNFTQLIEHFSNGALQKTREGNRQKHRVVKLSRGDNVFLHPATLLAALIWSIYVESDDLVLLSQDEQEEPSQDDAVRLVNDLAENPPTHELLNEAAFINGHSSDTDLVGGRISDHPEVGDSGLVMGPDYAPQRDLTGKNGMFSPQTVIATGLSAIAVAVGLLSESFIDQQPDAELADLLAKLPDTPDDEAALLANAEGADKSKGLDLAAVVTSFFDHLIPDADAHASALSDKIAADTSPPTAESILSAEVMQLLSELAENLRTDIDAGPGTPPATTVEITDLIRDLPATDETLAGPPSPAPGDTAAASLAGFVENALELAGLQNIFDDMLHRYAVGDTVIEASFDIASIDRTEANALGHLLPGETAADNAEPARQDDGATVASAPPAPQQAEDDRFAFELFDDNVRKFVNHLLDKSEKVEMIATESELIFIDFAAFDELGDTSLTMSWSLNGGGTVSVVGLESEFQDFDLIVA